jgi:DNA repair exonuclease SbcCD nuclease subunit
MEVLLIGDVHLSDRPPSLRTETYAQDILDKLWYTVGEAHDREVDAVVWAGDIFHIKAPSRTSHWLVQETVKIGQAYERPWLIVPGNHDMQHDRIASLDKQPLGVLFKAGAIPLVGEVAVGPATIFGIPWLYDWARELPSHMERWNQAESANLMVAHAPIFPDGETPPYEHISASQWAGYMARAGDVFYGHIHDPHGEYVVDDIRFCNQGALSRGSLHEQTLKRKPAVTLYTRSGFERIEVPHKPVRQVFALDQKLDVDKRQDRLDTFLESVEHTELEGLSVEAVMAHVEGLELKPQTKQTIQECLEEAMSR